MISVALARNFISVGAKVSSVLARTFSTSGSREGFGIVGVNSDIASLIKV